MDSQTAHPPHSELHFFFPQSVPRLIHMFTYFHLRTKIDLGHLRRRYCAVDATETPSQGIEDGQRRVHATPKEANNAEGGDGIRCSGSRWIASAEFRREVNGRTPQRLWTPMQKEMSVSTWCMTSIFVFLSGYVLLYAYGCLVRLALQNAY